jgi:hypothetical protein
MEEKQLKELYPLSYGVNANDCILTIKENLN